MDENNLYKNPNEGEIELDPDIEEIVGDKAHDNEKLEQGNAAPNFPYSEFTPPIEPIAPVMPIVENGEYKPVEKSGSSKGMKVFATIVAIMVLVSAAVTVGYFLGSANGKNTVKVDLASKPNPKDAKSVSQIYEETNKSVVGIYVYNEKGVSSSASGVIYTKDGYVVTNDHIYGDVAAAKFKVYTYDGKMHSAKYIAGDTRSDLAVLKIDGDTQFTPAVFGNSNELVVGETVIAVGRPNGATLPTSASEGIVSSTSRRVSITSSYTGNYIQTDTAINPGSSGGALCNLYGQVVGITSAKLVGDSYEGVGFAIPTTTMKKIVDSLIEYKCVKGRAKLGISYQAIDELTAEITGVPCGLKITSIDKSSGLYGKQVSQGDIITQVGGVKITDSNIVLDVIENSVPGDTINFTVYLAKEKSSIDVSVKLLADEGESSYVGKTQNSEGNSGDNNKYNSSEFSFPNGE